MSDLERAVLPDEMIKSLIMPEITVRIPMPEGAAVPAPAPSQPARREAAAPQDASGNRGGRSDAR